jgi:O-antigen/teichoic acid export membrane protein
MSRMMFISVTGAIYAQVDRVIISKLMPIRVTGYYGVVYGNVSKGQFLTRAISSAAYPSFSRFYQESDSSAFLAQYQKIQDAVCFGTVPFFAFFPFAAMPLFSYIFSADIARSLFVPATLLCLGFFMNGTLTIPYIVLLAANKPGIAARQQLYNLLIVLPLTAVLIMAWGLAGAALSVVLYSLFSYIYSIPRVCAECLKMPAWKWYAHIGKIVLLTVMTYGLAGLTLAIVGRASLLFLALAYGAATAAYLGGSYFLISPELKNTLLGYLRTFAGIRKEIPSA